MKTDNELIAEFMGLEKTQKDSGEATFKQENNAVVWASQLKYDKSWDWLESVGEKIEDMGYYINYEKLRSSGLYFFAIKSRGHEMICDSFDVQKIRSFYNLIVKFIKWYNLTTVSPSPSSSPRQD